MKQYQNRTSSNLICNTAWKASSKEEEKGGRDFNWQLAKACGQSSVISTNNRRVVVGYIHINVTSIRIRPKRELYDKYLRWPATLWWSLVGDLLGYFFFCDVWLFFVFVRYWCVNRTGLDSDLWRTIINYANVHQSGFQKDFFFN